MRTDIEVSVSLLRRVRGPSFGESTAMAKQSLIKEFALFVKHEKKWWLIPLIGVLLLVGVLYLFAVSSPMAPFIYPLF